MNSCFRKGVLIASLFCFTLFASCGTLPRPTVSDIPTTAVTVTATTVVTTLPTAATAATAVPQQPEALTAWLAEQGVTYADLEARSCTQLIVAEYVAVHFFECRNGQWQEHEMLSTCGWVGKNGVTSSKTEGDGCTPLGLYAIGEAFYRDFLPQTGLPTFRITDETYWVDDPESQFYNQRVEGTAQQDWQSAEHMADYDCYRYGFTVQYNVPAVKGAGSAIFFHIGMSPTLGCIAVSEEMVLEYLEELDIHAHPHILIV